ncbi:MAG: FUN14 domain-containing protein [Candidatus Bathyarchaeia archaeon]
MSEALIPIAYQLGVGGIGGFFVGYAVKKITRIAIIIGVVVFSFAYLAFTGVINVNYDGLIKLWPGLSDPVLGLLAPFLSALPFLGSFIVGLWFGFKKG